MARPFLPYAIQEIDDEDCEAVTRVLRGEWLTTGPTVAEFEAKVAELAGARHGVAVNSGTAALDVAVGALELPPGSEAVTTPLTFAATSNALLYHGVKPVFADIDPETWNVDPEAVRRAITPKTRLLIFADYSGQPCDWEPLLKLAAERGIPTIEDAAHSLGAHYREKPVGSFATMTTFSFHPVKHITTGEGGLITTQDPQLDRKLRTLRTHGITREVADRYGKDATWAYDMVELGRNYRITDFQCALGVAQLRKLPRFLARRRELVARYFEQLPEGVEPVRERDDRRSAWHLFPVRLPRGVSRDAVFTAMRKRNIGVNVHYIPVYRHSYYRRVLPTSPEAFPVTEDTFARQLTLPLFPKMTDDDVRYVVESLAESIAEARR